MIRDTFCLTLVLMVTFGVRAEEAPPEIPSGREPAAVMSFLGADWLERPFRDKEQQPARVIEAMNLEPDDVVADIGAGTGYFARRIARAIPEGKVLGVEIQQEMLDLLMEYSKKEGVDNVVPVLGEEADPKLPKGGVDWILLVDVYHEFQDPMGMLAKMRESLKPDGKVALIEYRLLGDTAKHIKESHRMSVEQVMAEWNPAGFQLVDLMEWLPSQHFFVFERSCCVCEEEESGSDEE